MNPSIWRVRPAVAALPAALLVTLLCRSMVHGVGADELSLLTMGQSIHAGFFPYEEYWDVRPPLAYLWALPSAYLDDATRAVAMLRLLAWLAQALAAWDLLLPVQKNARRRRSSARRIRPRAGGECDATAHDGDAEQLLHDALRVAFACLVAGRRGRPAIFVLSGLLAGLMPWVMTQAALVPLSLGLVALCSPCALGANACSG